MIAFAAQTDLIDSNTELEDRRFAGLSRLYGRQGALAIRRAHVVVVGIGGVGSWAAEALARSGVAMLTLIDLDHVSESNINRQIHATTCTVGQAKVLAMQARIASIHPRCTVRPVDAFVRATNWPELVGTTNMAGVAAVIDACDDGHAKVALARWAFNHGGPFICVGAAGGKRHAHRVDIADLSAVTHDPLLAQLRKRLRKEHDGFQVGKTMRIPCVYSAEAVTLPDALCSFDGLDGSLNCSGYGSVVSVTATFGQCAAGWVLDRIAASGASETL